MGIGGIAGEPHMQYHPYPIEKREVRSAIGSRKDSDSDSMAACVGRDDFSSPAQVLYHTYIIYMLIIPNCISMYLNISSYR
jgi:hypothetical protein